MEQHPVSFVCPSCHGHLRQAMETLACVNCGEVFPVLDGIPRFVNGDEFYEGRWAEPDLSDGSLRNLLVKKERFFHKQLPRDGANILDLGCGGGWRLFARVGYSVGIDLSHQSLCNARRIYDQVAQATLTKLPFPDESFDFVVSTDVLGHLAEGEKDTVINEIRRVLKTGGRTLHYIEADGNDPLMRFAKRYPGLYAKHIVGPEGHIGLEPVDEILQRFIRSGFKLVKARPCYKGLTYVSRLVLYFDNDYKEKSPFIKVLVNACSLMTRAKFMEMAANVIVSLLIELGDWVFPDHWAGGLLICCEKVGLRSSERRREGWSCGSIGT